MVSALRPVFSRQPLGDVGGAAAGAGQPPGALDDHRPLFVGQLAELRAAAHPLLVVLDEAIHRALQEADPLAAVHHEPPADQPLAPPAGNGLGRDVELLGQLLDRQHPLARRLGRHAGRIGNVLDEQPQVVAGLLAGQLQVGVRLGPVVGDPVADVLVGVGPAGVQFAQQPLGLRHLLEFLLAGREPHLLVAELPDGRIQIVGVHDSFLQFSARLPGSITGGADFSQPSLAKITILVNLGRAMPPQYCIFTSDGSIFALEYPSVGCQHGTSSLMSRLPQLALRSRT